MTFNGPYSPGNWPEGSFFNEMELIDEAECWHKIYGDYTNYKRKRSRLAKQVKNGMKLTAAVMSANFCKPTVESPIKRVREFLKNLLRNLCHNEGALFPVQWDFTTRDDFCEHPTYSSTAETGVGNHQFMSAYRLVITFEYHQFDVLEETIAEKSIERFEFEDHKLSNIASNFPANRFEVAKKRFQHAHSFFKLLIEKCIDMLYGFVVHWKLRDEEKHQQDLSNFEKKNVLRVAQWSNVDFSVVKRALTKRSVSEDVEKEPPKKISVVEEKKLTEQVSSWTTPFPLLKSMILNEKGLQNNYQMSPDENSEEINHNKVEVAVPAPKYVEQEAIESVREAAEVAHSEVVEQEQEEEEEEEEELFPRTVPMTESFPEHTEHVLKVDMNANERANVLTECTPSPSSRGTPETYSAPISPTENQQPSAQFSQTEIIPQISFRLYNRRLEKLRKAKTIDFSDEAEKEKQREEEIDRIVAFSEKFHANLEHPMFAGRPRYFQLFTDFTRIREMMFGDMVEKWKDEFVLNARMSVMARAIVLNRKFIISDKFLQSDAYEYFKHLKPDMPAPWKKVKKFIENCLDDIFFASITEEDEIMMPRRYLQKMFDISVMTNPGDFQPKNVKIQWFHDYDVPNEDELYLKGRMQELCRHIMSDLVRTVFVVKENPETKEFEFYYNRCFQIPKTSD